MATVAVETTIPLTTHHLKVTANRINQSVKTIIFLVMATVTMEITFYSRPG